MAARWACSICSAMSSGSRWDADGAIAAVHTREQGALTAGLYVDCTGFRARLIGEALGSPFKSVSDTLFVDRALALQVPYDTPDAPIPSVHHLHRP
jgi:tryptophan halogenase